MSASEILSRLEWSDDGLPRGWPNDQNVATAGPEILAWSEVVLSQPDGDDAGQPWRWRQSQARFVSWWYSLDHHGNYLWRRGQVVLMKGAGKVQWLPRSRVASSGALSASLSGPTMVRRSCESILHLM
jgi:hypothetical protein